MRMKSLSEPVDSVDQVKSRCWDDLQEKPWNDVKSLIVSAPVLAYYRSGEVLEIQRDSSQSGLGAALMQNGHPIAYASRALTEVKSRYAQIEKQKLAIVFSVKKFNDYRFGRWTIIYTDHKPLESIVKKPLHRTTTSVIVTFKYFLC